MKHPLTRNQVWGMPLFLGIVSVTGLIAALVSDGAGDVLSWAALSMPVAVIIRYVWL